MIVAAILRSQTARTRSAEKAEKGQGTKAARTRDSAVSARVNGAGPGGNKRSEGALDLLGNDDDDDDDDDGFGSS